MNNIMTNCETGRINKQLETYTIENCKYVCVALGIWALHDIIIKALEKGNTLHFEVNCQKGIKLDVESPKIIN